MKCYMFYIHDSEIDALWCCHPESYVLSISSLTYEIFDDVANKSSG